MDISWWALAMTFASLPGLSLVGYSYLSGYVGERRSIRGYINTVRSLYKAKNDGIKETSRLLAGRWSPAFAIVFTIVLFLFPKDTPLALMVNIASLPAGEIALWIGRRTRIADGIPVEQAKESLTHLTPAADLRQTLAVLWIVGAWAGFVALGYTIRVLLDRTVL